MFRYSGFDDALEMVQAIYEVGGKGHSCGIYSFDDDHIDRLARVAPVSRIMVRQPQSKANAGAFNNGMPMTSSLGCGTWGGNITSENIHLKHYMNVTWVSRPIAEDRPSEPELFGEFYGTAGRRRDEPRQPRRSSPLISAALASSGLAHLCETLGSQPASSDRRCTARRPRAPRVDDGRRRGRDAVLALADRRRPALRPDLLQLLVQPRPRSVREARRVASCAPQLRPLDLVVRERQQELARRASTERQRTAELDERPELVACLDGGDADPRVVVTNVEVHALADLVAQTAHRRLGNAQVERLGRASPQ